MVRYLVYAGIVIAAATLGATLSPDRSQQGERPPFAIDPTPPTVATAAPTDPGSSLAHRELEHHGEPPATSLTATVTANSTPLTGQPPADIGDHHIDGDVDDGAPPTVTDAAAQFAVAALNDRYDTTPADRTAGLSDWATPAVVVAWPTMTNDERQALTVRSALVDRTTDEQLDTATWRITIDATVTTSSADAATTAVAARLELLLELNPASGRPQVTAATVETEPLR